MERQVYARKWEQIVVHNQWILTQFTIRQDLKLIPICHMLSSGWFTGVCSLNANVSENYVCSIFIGE
jgi:hypothetical protein